jgi:hypothetical protein
VAFRPPYVTPVRPTFRFYFILFYFFFTHVLMPAARMHADTEECWTQVVAVRAMRRQRLRRAAPEPEDVRGAVHDGGDDHRVRGRCRAPHNIVYRPLVAHFIRHRLWCTEALNEAAMTVTEEITKSVS